MKRKILLAVFICFIGTTTFAQISGGLKAGLNIGYQGWQSDDADYDESSTGIGYHVGGVLNLMFGEKIGLQTEIMYSSTIFNIEENLIPAFILAVETGKEQKSVTMSNISVPLLFVYQFSSWRLEGGAQYSIITTNPSEAEKLLYKTSSIDFIIGASADFGSNKKFFGSIRAVISDPGGEITEGSGNDLVIGNVIGQLSVGYRLFGNKE